MSARTKPILKCRLVATHEAQPTKSQHRAPCADCPFARCAIPGWLGGHEPEMWEGRLMGDGDIECHCTTNQQCAGAAVMRANMCKVPKSATALTLPSNKKLCFSNPEEFHQHHAPKSKWQH